MFDGLSCKYFMCVYVKLQIVIIMWGWRYDFLRVLCVRVKLWLFYVWIKLLLYIWVDCYSFTCVDEEWLCVDKIVTCLCVWVKPWLFMCGGEIVCVCAAKRECSVEVDAPWGDMEVQRNLPALKFFHDLSSGQYIYRFGEKTKNKKMNKKKTSFQSWWC